MAAPLLALDCCLTLMQASNTQPPAAQVRVLTVLICDARTPPATEDRVHASVTLERGQSRKGRGLQLTA